VTRRMEKTTYQRTFLPCTPQQIYSGVKLRMRYAGHVARLGDRSGAYRVLIGRREWCIQGVDWETGGVHTGC
jgi:hypothetical protein